MNDVQPGLDLFQLVGGIAQAVPGVPNLLGGVLNLIHEVGHPLMQSVEAVAEPGQPREGVLRLGKQPGGAVGIVPAVETFHGRFHAVAQLFGVLQDFPAVFQSFVLPRLQLRLFDLGDLVFQGLHAAQLFPFVHGQAVNFPPQLRHRLVFFSVIAPKRLVPGKGVQEGQMVVLVKQRRGIMLAMDVDELDAQLPQNGHGDQASVDPADVFPVQENLPLDDGLRVVFHAVVLKPL